MTASFQLLRICRETAIKNANSTHATSAFYRRAYYTHLAQSFWNQTNKPGSVIHIDNKNQKLMTSRNYSVFYNDFNNEHRSKMHKKLLGMFGKSLSFYHDVKNKNLQTSTSKMINDLPKTESKSNSQEESRSDQQHSKERKKIEVPVVRIVDWVFGICYVTMLIFAIRALDYLRKRRENEINKIAVHEAGHAVMAYSSRYIDVDHVTIVPRFEFEGLTHGHMEPTRIDGGTKDLTMEEMEDYIDIGHGGDVAEEIVFRSDGERSEYFDQQDKLRWEITPDNRKIDYILSLFSPELQKEWMTEQKKESRRRTKEFLTQHRVELDMLTEALLAQKTLQNKDVTNLFQGSTLVNKGAVETDGVETTNKGKTDFIQSTKLINTGAEKIVEVYFPNKA